MSSTIVDGRKNRSINPFLPSYEYIPDGEPRIFNNRLYIYGSHDLYNQESYCGGDYVTWSAPIDDLASWQYEGIIYRREQDPYVKKRLDKGKDSMMKTHLFAPDVVEIEGKYYMYYGIGLSSAGLGVAVANSPSGPFTYLGRVKYPSNDEKEKPYGKNKSPLTSPKTYIYDPAIIYDNGRLFLYFGLAFCRVVELDIKDKMTVVKNPKTKKYYSEPLVPSMFSSKKKKANFNGIGMVNGPSIRKINDKYYLAYYGKDANKGNVMCVAVANSPFGPFIYGGTLVSVGNANFNNQKIASMYDGNTHGGMIEIDNQWYIIYHRHTKKGTQNRQAMVAPVDLTEDGSFKQGMHNCLGFSKKPLDAYCKWPAYMVSDIYNSDGKIEKTTTPYLIQEDLEFGDYDQETSKNTLQVITNITKESILGYRTFDFGNNQGANVTLNMHAKCAGYISIHIDDYKKTEIGRVEIIAGENYQDYTGKVSGLNGSHDVYFIFHPSDDTFGKLAFLTFTNI